MNMASRIRATKRKMKRLFFKKKKEKIAIPSLPFFLKGAPLLLFNFFSEKNGGRGMQRKKNPLSPPLPRPPSEGLENSIFYIPISRFCVARKIPGGKEERRRWEAECQGNNKKKDLWSNGSQNPRHSTNAGRSPGR